MRAPCGGYSGRAGVAPPSIRKNTSSSQREVSGAQKRTSVQPGESTQWHVVRSGPHGSMLAVWVHKHAFSARGRRIVLDVGESSSVDSSTSVDPMEGFYHGDALELESVDLHVD